jgi:hypothetical protein
MVRMATWFSVGTLLVGLTWGCGPQKSGNSNKDTAVDTGTGSDAKVSVDTAEPDTAEPDTADPPPDTAGPDVKVPECASHTDCDDGIECTSDVCTIEGKCTNDLPTGVCYIDTVCMAGGIINPANECEICDPNNFSDQWTPRPEVACDDGDPCTAESKCNKGLCEGKAMDACCGNGKVEEGETCDGDCPAECVATGLCTKVIELVGTPENCDVVCQTGPVTECVSGDGCCPKQCTNAVDNDCEKSCGNGVVDPGETCDGNCPTECGTTGPCSKVLSFTGTPENCDVVCETTPISNCVSGDGCCPKNCTNQVDADCPISCGNGMLDPGETCDGNCPTACFNSNPCIDVALVGSATTCNAKCEQIEQKACAGGDGCCPSGCSTAVDSDCDANQCELEINIQCTQGAGSPGTYQISALDPEQPGGVTPHGYLFYKAGDQNITFEDVLTNFCLQQTGVMLLGMKSGCVVATYEIGTCIPLDYPKKCQAKQCYSCP